MAIKNLTLKIQGQGHGWGQSLKSQLGSNILSIHILLVPCQFTVLFLGWSFFFNLTFKIQGQSQSQSRYNILSTHILRSMLIGPPAPEIQLFQKLILKIQGQGHEWGQSSKSQCESNILWTHIPFIPCQSALPFLRYSIFQNMTLKIQVQGHSSRSQSRYNTLSTHTPFVPCRSVLPFLGYSYFNICRR